MFTKILFFALFGAIVAISLEPPLVALRYYESSEESRRRLYRAVLGENVGEEEYLDAYSDACEEFFDEESVYHAQFILCFVRYELLKRPASEHKIPESQLEELKQLMLKYDEICKPRKCTTKT